MNFNEEMLQLRHFLKFSVIMFVILLIVPIVFFTKNALIVILLAMAVIFSRSTALYDHLKVEFHSVLILAMSSIYGPATGIFAALVSAPLVNVVGKTLGCFQKPPWLALDTLALSIVAYLTVFIPEAKLFEYGLLVIILFENILVGMVRIYLFRDPMERRFMLSIVNIMFNYIILKNFLPKILSFLH